MSTPEQPASDAAKPSEQALKAAFEIYKLRWSAELTVLQTGRVIDRETKMPELRAQLAAQSSALSAAKDALEEVAKAVLQYQKVCPADPDTTRQFLLAGADLDCAMAITTTALSQIRALGNT